MSLFCLILSGGALLINGLGLVAALGLVYAVAYLTSPARRRVAQPAAEAIAA